ncbi:hypothetical protein [Pseudoalteromonas sp. Of7M-16]|uniref:hypothetical protein n=1 Tax=Pseudoalteromonas sp. Of7M-16 TaxID=2917756 RepID=UPI001EF6CBB5|nr:hypothetical protein [Pseudoalteromonas sp. Of7M-16]MCG7549188.1 hypothetical protein [Pseudoalteromonas sp. Of7M-16]
MNKTNIFLSLAVLAAATGAIYQNEVHETTEHNAHNIQAIQNTKDQEPNPLSETPKKLPPAYDENSSEELLNKLAQTNLNELKPLIESFWQNCLRQSECDALLAELHTHASSHRYLLVAEYPAKKQEFDQLTASEDFNTTTVEKVSRIKRIYTQVWGDLATELFHEEFAFYNTRATLAELTDLSQEMTPDEFIEQLDILSQQGKVSSDAQEQYSIAIEILGTSMTPNELSHLRSQLARRYFDHEQAQAVLVRQQQILNQQETVLSYRQALSEKKAQLQMLKGSEYAHLSAQQWQTHYDTELKSFRKAFFQRN